MVSQHNKALTDYEGSDRVGIAFDVHKDGILSNNDPIRIYPETMGCIDLQSEKNGYLGRQMFGSGESYSAGKSIGVPEATGMSKDRIELWVSAKYDIAIRTVYVGATGKTGYLSPRKGVVESVVTFKPEAGAFYYVTVDSNEVEPISKFMKVYQIIDDGTGRKTLQPVKELNIKNCPGQHPWYQKGGAIM